MAGLACEMPVCAAPVTAEVPLADPARPGGDTTAAGAAAPVLDEAFDAGTLHLLRAAVLARALACPIPPPEHPLTRNPLPQLLPGKIGGGCRWRYDGMVTCSCSACFMSAASWSAAMSVALVTTRLAALMLAATWSARLVS
jgi:hypothetical protein